MAEKEVKEEVTEEEKEEVKEEKENNDISSIFTDIKNIMLEQQKEIEALKSKINSFKEDEKAGEKKEKTAFDEFKDDIKKMLQGYNRGNPENTNNAINETFEKTQMDILNRRF